MFFGIIYKAISPSNKIYYGKSLRNLELRKKEHLKDSNKNRHFSNAIKKYGIEKFNWIILESYNKKSEEELIKILNEREKYWIFKNKTYLRKYGYNMTLGGEGTKGFKRIFSKEHKEKLSESHKGKKLSEEHKNNISKSEKGRIFSDEHKNKLKKVWKTTHPNNGKNMSEATKELLKQKSLNVKKIKCKHCQKEFTPWGFKHHNKKLKKYNKYASCKK